MPAGALHRRVLFEREAETPDGAGGYGLAWTDITTVWGSFMPQRGREQLEAGRLEGSVAGVLRIRSSAMAKTITGEDRASFDGDTYQIRSITNPDQRSKYIEMVVERGAAV